MTLADLIISILIFFDNKKVIELFPVERNLVTTYHFYQISSFFNHKHLLYGLSSVNENQDMDAAEIDFEFL